MKSRPPRGTRERDPVGLVGVRVDQSGAEIGGGFAGKMRRQHDACAQCRQARIGVAQAIFAVAGAVPDRHHAEDLRQILADHLGPQLVEIELFHQRADQRLRRIEKKAATILGRRFGDDEVDDDLALRRQQCGKARMARGDLGHIVGDEAIEEAPGVVADDLDHAAIGEKSCLHANSLGSLAIVSCQNSRRNVSAVGQASSPVYTR